MPRPRPDSPNKILFDNGMYFDIDSTGAVSLFDNTIPGVKLLTIATNGTITVISGNLILGTGAGNIQIKSGGIGNVNNIPTAGATGFGAIFAAGAQSLNTNVAPTTLSYTPPATAGVYRISGYLDILTGGTMTVQLKITYKDPGGNARTDIPVLTQQNSATLLAGSPGANVTGRFWFVAIIAVDNSATAITVADNAGTYTAGTYYFTPIIEQLA
jgi:hypothetical protein